MGMGGVTLTAVCAMFLLRIVNWEDIQGGVAGSKAADLELACQFR